MQAHYEEEEEVFDGDMDFGVNHLASDQALYNDAESGKSPSFPQILRAALPQHAANPCAIAITLQTSTTQLRPQSSRSLSN